MAEAKAVLELEARDRASAQVKAFAGEVEAASQATQRAAVQTRGMAGGMTDMVTRVREAQVPLRNISAILGGFGLSFIGISAVTMGIRQMVMQAIEAEKAFLAFQLNLRRWGLSVDDATRLVNEFRSVLGRAAATDLAQIDEATAKWFRLLDEDQGKNVLLIAKRLSDLTGIPVTKILKDWGEDVEEFGGDTAKATAKMKELGDTTWASMTVVQQQSYLAKRSIGDFFSGLLSGGGNAIDSMLALGKEFSDWDLKNVQPLRDVQRAEERKTVRETKTGLTDLLAFLRDWVTNFHADWEVGLSIWEGMISTTLGNIGSLFGDTLGGIGEAIGTQLGEWGEAIGTKWTEITTLGLKIWAGFWDLWGKGWDAIVKFVLGKLADFGTWMGNLGKGIGDFWTGIWGAIRSFGESIWGWVAGRLNDLIGMVNTVIGLVNSALGVLGVTIPSIPSIVTARTAPAAPVGPAIPSYLPPAMPSLGGTIVIPISIGDKPLTEIIINTLTGAIRERELGT